MDAIEFIRERNRMCATYTSKRCEGCPADNYGERDTACIMIDKIDAKRLVPIVEKWSSEHPLKTRQSVFLEQYPETLTDIDDVLDICPAVISHAYRGDESMCAGLVKMCSSCRRKFWTQEVE